MLLLPEHPLPPKPRYLEACNGCGLCCSVEVCEAGKIAMPGVKAPCPMLEFRDGRTFCKLVATEKAFGLEPILAKALAIGVGCGMED